MGVLVVATCLLVVMISMLSLDCLGSGAKVLEVEVHLVASAVRIRSVSPREDFSAAKAPPESSRF